MYSHEASDIFCNKYGINKQSYINQDVRKMIEIEAEEEIKSGRLKGLHSQHSLAIEIALNRASEWFEMAKEYNCNPVYDFVASHRHACVYFVLLGKGLERGGD